MHFVGGDAVDCRSEHGKNVPSVYVCNVTTLLAQVYSTLEEGNDAVNGDGRQTPWIAPCEVVGVPLQSAEMLFLVITYCPLIIIQIMNNKTITNITIMIIIINFSYIFISIIS